ncbi:hypothetical protein CCICO_11025 [Corynebacterium ciconiae DSM 44920]|uniref:hypothetical protein n=1 Tax=Corynebacterium ciconiae TaxID=227319 RepID=UPI00037FFC20|nr:hypothetical protein [Corynebacterium ciconiae]WKD62200.1 hypothetical protein CCICO_11025 [Corynebacterium ciconiae DSM 44920]
MSSLFALATPVVLAVFAMGMERCESSSTTSRIRKQRREQQQAVTLAQAERETTAEHTSDQAAA